MRDRSGTLRDSYPELKSAPGTSLGTDGAPVSLEDKKPTVWD